jgi:hypothetical protein
VQSKGDDRVYCDFGNAAECIHALGGIISVHAGKKSNSIENISNAEKFKQAVKADLARKAIDIFEVGKVTDVEEYRKIVFPFLNREYPLVICSDNHDAKNYVAKASLWIKADPTFEGLKQVINEPQDRCFIGEIPPKLARVSNNKTKYIRSIEIKKNLPATFKKLGSITPFSLAKILTAKLVSKHFWMKSWNVFRKTREPKM